MISLIWIIKSYSFLLILKIHFFINFRNCIELNSWVFSYVPINDLSRMLAAIWSSSLILKTEHFTLWQFFLALCYTIIILIIKYLGIILQYEIRGSHWLCKCIRREILMNISILILPSVLSFRNLIIVWR